MKSLEQIIRLIRATDAEIGAHRRTCSDRDCGYGRLLHDRVQTLAWVLDAVIVTGVPSAPVNKPVNKDLN